MNAFLKRIFLLSVILFSTNVYSASLLGQEPDASVIYTASNGLEWVYASPCLDGGCSNIQLHHDFRFAESFEWIDSFGDLNGLIAAFSLNNFDSSMCAATYFDLNYNHCDPSDAVNGYLAHSPFDLHGNNYFSELFLVRNAISPVPVPAAAFLFGPALLGFMGLRRKAKKA